MKSAKRRQIEKQATHPETARLGDARDRKLARSVHQDLTWYFGYAETALARGGVSMLPSHLAAFGAESPEATVATANGLARSVSATLNALSGDESAVLRAFFTPRRWPAPVEREFRALAPIVVRLFVADSPWPARHAHEGLESAVACQLARGIAARHARLATLRAAADRLVGRAIRAYVAARSAS